MLFQMANPDEKQIGVILDEIIFLPSELLGQVEDSSICKQNLGGNWNSEV